MPNPELSAHALRVADLPQNRPATFDVTPDGAILADIAQHLSLIKLQKLRFAGEVVASGAADFALSGKLGATVVQPCIVTLAPVQTRIDIPVERLYLRDFTDPEADEAEMPEDERAEPLGAWIDPVAVMVEALSLALPLYPRSEDASLAQSQFAAPGIRPMSDEAAHPFAGLAALRGTLSKNE